MLQLETGDVVGLHRDWYREGWAEGRLAAMRELREEVMDRSLGERVVVFLFGFGVGLVTASALIWLLS